MRPIRIAIVADIHHGADVITKRGSAALPLLSRFVADASEADAVIDLGDRISDVDADADRALQRAVAEVFAPLQDRRHHVCGNHDVAHLTLAQNEAILDRPLASRVVDLGHLRLAFWQPDVTLTATQPPRLVDGDLDALSGLLDDDRPTVLVSHIPVSGASQTGNHWFENNPRHATYAGSLGAIRAVIGGAPGPVLALAGHVHWNTITQVDGVAHLTQQSLTESCTTAGEPSVCTGLLTVEADMVRWKVTGLDPCEVSLPWSSRKRRWTKPLHPFSERGLDHSLMAPVYAGAPA